MSGPKYPGITKPSGELSADECGLLSAAKRLVRIEGLIVNGSTSRIGAIMTAVAVQSSHSQSIESHEAIDLACVLSIGVRLALAALPIEPMSMAGIPVSQCRAGGSRHFHY